MEPGQSSKVLKLGEAPLATQLVVIELIKVCFASSLVLVYHWQGGYQLKVEFFLITEVHVQNQENLKCASSSWKMDFDDMCNN